MPPRLNLSGTRRSLAVRSRPLTSPITPIHLRASCRRGYADEAEPKGPNQDSLPHVSEEAAELGEVMGETKPELDQGTPVQEILQRDEEGRENAPNVIQEEMDKSKDVSAVTFDDLMALAASRKAAERQITDRPGHKFPLPTLPLPPFSNHKYRYDSVVTQVTNLLMKDGKKSIAQRNMGFILNHLRTSPPPTPNPSRPMLPGSPPPSHLPLDPVQYLTLAIDSVAPLLRIRNQKGAAGGGQSLQIPIPLRVRQRRRTAMKWILDAAEKKPSRGSGRGQFAKKVAEELISVIEGRSTAWDKRAQVHKLGTAARTNINWNPSMMGKNRLGGKK